MKVALKETPILCFPMGSKPAETKEELYEALLSIRRWMLWESDWTQTSDSPLDEDTKNCWRIWRQELRDITERITVETVGDYFEISDPPEKGKPKSWSGWEYENYYNIIQIFKDVSAQSMEETKGG